MYVCMYRNNVNRLDLKLVYVCMNVCMYVCMYGIMKKKKSHTKIFLGFYRSRTSSCGG